MNREESATVTYLDVEWDVSGEWLEYIPPTRIDCGYGGCFYDYTIKLHGFDLTEALSDETIQEIVF